MIKQFIKTKRKPTEVQYKLDRNSLLYNLEIEPSWIKKLPNNPIPLIIQTAPPADVFNLIRHIYAYNFKHTLYRMVERFVFHDLKRKNLISFSKDNITESLISGVKTRDIEFYDQLLKVHRIDLHGGTQYLDAVSDEIVNLMKYQNDDGRFPLLYHHHAHTCTAVINLGIKNNRLIDRAINWLLSRQRDDGGWLHRKNVLDGQKHSSSSSCIWTTAECAMLLSKHSSYRQSDSIKKAIDFLKSKVLKENQSTLLPGLAGWDQLSISDKGDNIFAGGTLKILEILTACNYNPSDRVFKKLYNWLLNIQMDNGMFPHLGNTIPASNTQVTLRAISIIKKVESSR